MTSTTRTPPPALAPGMALLFAGWTHAEIATLAREGLRFMVDLAAAAAEELGAILTLPLGVRAAAHRDGADLPVEVPVAEAARCLARDTAGPIRGASLPSGQIDHLLPSERFQWRFLWAVRASRAALSALVERWGLRLAKLARSRRRTEVNGPLPKQKVRAPLGSGFARAQGHDWTTGKGTTRRLAADAPMHRVASYALGEIRDNDLTPPQRGLTRAEQRAALSACLSASA